MSLKAKILFWCDEYSWILQNETLRVAYALILIVATDLILFLLKFELVLLIDATLHLFYAIDYGLTVFYLSLFQGFKLPQNLFAKLKASFCLSFVQFIALQCDRMFLGKCKSAV